MAGIAIFGGSFNPVHNGHLHLALALEERFAFDRILMIPTNIPPHKPAHDLATGEHRMAMLRLAVEQYPFLVPDDRELRREGKSYTVDTLRELSREYPEQQLFLLMGADMLTSFTAWKDYREITRLATLIAAGRTEEKDELFGMERAADHLRSEGARVKICDIPVLEIASTMLRKSARRGDDLREYTPVSVAEYIQAHQLYKGGEGESTR